MQPSSRLRWQFCLAFLGGQFVSVTSVISFPFNLIVWGAYNRHKMNIWLILFVIFTGIYTPFTIYKLMYSLRVWLFFAFGCMLSMAFVAARKASFKLFVLHQFEKLHERVLLIIAAMLLALPVPIIVVVFHLLDKDNPNALAWLFPVEVSLSIWTALIIFLFIKYPDDGWEAFLFKWFSSRFPSVDLKNLL